MSFAELGAYPVGKVVAAGDFSTIYAVNDDRNLLIKVLPDLLTDEASFKTRFDSQLELITQVTHPNLLQLYDYGIEGTHPYIVLQAMPQSLDDLMDTEGMLSIGNTLALLRPIFDAVDFLHAQGLAHGDIKPTNILLKRDNTPLLADTGLQKLIRETLSLLGEEDAVVGTVPYLSPEQQRGDNASAQGDVWSLGMLAYRALTGILPEGQEIPAASTMNSDLPAALDKVLLRALHPYATQRYRTVTGFLEALEVALLGEAAIAEDETSTERVRHEPFRPARFVRRLGCGALLMVWFVLMLWPCVLLTVIMEGEFVVTISDRPNHDARIFNVQSDDTRGFGFSYAEVQEESSERLCIKTYVRYIMWEGSNEPVDYCRCYERVDEQWLTSPAVNDQCETLDNSESLSISAPGIQLFYSPPVLD